MLSTTINRSFAQPLVTEVGGGVGLLGISSLLPDTVQNRLLLAGWFAYANEIPVSPGILQWDGADFGSFGCGVGWDCIQSITQVGLANPSRAIAIWNDEVYLGGDFSFVRDSVEYKYIMRWDGNDWHPLPGGVNGGVKSLKVFDGELYAAGGFTYADTILCNGLARWDGTRWHKVVDIPAFYNGSGANLVHDVEKFQGQWYLGGNLPAGKDLVRYNGQEWEIVGGGFTGAYSSVNRLKVHNDRLYVAGTFARCPPLGNGVNPGNGIVAWDGEQWDDLGGGTCGSTNGNVWNMTWMRDTLYAVGNFNRAGGVEGGRFAKWDGNQWCMLLPPGYLGTGIPAALAVHHDSLFIGGGFQQAGTDVVRGFGKWVGGNYTYACGTLTNVDELPPATAPFTLAPNPTHGTLHLMDLPATAQHAEVYDLTGRRVFHQRLEGRPLDVQALATGTYLLTVRDGAGHALGTRRFVRE